MDRTLAQIDRILLDGIPASLLARLNDLTAQYTGSKTLAEFAFECLRGGNTYRPTVHCTPFKSTASEARRAAQCQYFADGFDAAMELLGSTKRAWRG